MNSMITKTLTEQLKDYREYLETTELTARDIELSLLEAERFIDYLKLYE